MHLQHSTHMLEAGALQLVSEGEASATFGFIVSQGPLIRVQLALLALTLMTEIAQLDCESKYFINLRNFATYRS